MCDEGSKYPIICRLLGHPAFAWLGLRRVISQHTVLEEAALKRWSAGRSSLIEIGVAEGASALALRKSMSPKATLYLIDPFHLSRYPLLNTTKRAALRAVASCRNGRVVWIEKFSRDAAEGWNQPIDFLFVDGDHSEQAVRQDWDDWCRFVVPGGVVAFHDARAGAFGSWPDANFGPVKVVDRLFRQHSILGWKIVDEVDSLVVVQRSG
jgi:predicted O-methyltransferase YrrM